MDDIITVEWGYVNDRHMHRCTRKEAWAYLEGAESNIVNWFNEWLEDDKGEPTRFIQWSWYTFWKGTGPKPVAVWRY